MRKLAFISIIASLLLVTGCGYGDRETVTTKVESKERVCDQKDCKYLVFTEAGTFQVSDSIVLGRFDSSDVYGRIKEEKTYEIVSVGWRIPFLSVYPNIETATLVDGNK